MATKWFLLALLLAVSVIVSAFSFFENPDNKIKQLSTLHTKGGRCDCMVAGRTKAG
jgi:hypothetical protein